MLALDAHGRPYVASVGHPGETLDLIKESVARFYSVQQFYPSVILLSPFRFLLLGGRATHYKINGVYIPIQLDETTYVESRFDVMVRGEAL
jgi:hypothetical protein